MKTIPVRIGFAFIFPPIFFLGDLVLIACRAVGVIVLPWTQGEFNVFSYGLQAIGLDD